jgi:hypothetical protein
MIVSGLSRVFAARLNIYLLFIMDDMVFVLCVIL